MTTYLCICTKTREEAVIETVAKPKDYAGCDGYIFGRVVGNHPLKGQLFAKPNSEQSKRWEAVDYYEYPISKHTTRFLVEHKRTRVGKTVTLFHSRLAEAYEEMKRKEVA